LKILDEAGLCVSQGGRFLTIQDKEVDKGKAVTMLTHLFEKEWKEKPLSIGIGDSPNDASFLKVVDKAFLVQKHDGNWADFEIHGMKKVAAIGPKGFLTVAQNIHTLQA
jgi:mannosyl-3-phosphoglycerate phosphatase